MCIDEVKKSEVIYKLPHNYRVAKCRLLMYILLLGIVSGAMLLIHHESFMTEADIICERLHKAENLLKEKEAEWKSELEEKIVNFKSRK